MKKIVLSIAMGAALVAGATAQTISSQMEVHLAMSTPELNLYFLDQGFLDLNLAHSSVGMMNNPGGLGLTGIMDVTAAGSLSRSTSLNSDIKLMDSTDVTGEIKIPTYFTLIDQGGLDYVGVAGKMGPFGVGIAYQRSFALEAGLDQADLDITQKFNYTYEDTIDSDASGPLPGGLQIPVTYNVSAVTSVSLKGSGEAKISNQPIFIGAGTKYGPFNLGMGIKVTKIEAIANTSLKLDANIDSLQGTLDGPIVSLTGDTVTFDNITVSTPLDDSIFFSKFSSNLTGTQYSLVMGGHMELPILKLGVSMELGMPYKLSGFYYNNAGLPEGQPILEDVDVSSLNFSSDSIAGEIGLELGGVQYVRKSDSDSGEIEMPGMTSLKTSLGLKLWGLRVGVNGGMDILNGEWPMIGNAYASLGTSLTVKRASLRLGLASRWQYLALEDDKLYSSTPMVILGAGLGIPFPKGELMLGSRINLANGILNTQNLEKQEELNPFKTIAFNAGIRVSI